MVDNPAWATDLLYGDHFVFGSSGLGAPGGYPYVQVPAANVFGIPFGLLQALVDGAKMVLVRVSDDKAHQFVSTIGDVGWIRHHHIDLGMCRAAKADTAVHRQPFAVAAVQVEVHADLACPAQRQEGEITVRNIHIVLL